MCVLCRQCERFEELQKDRGDKQKQCLMNEDPEGAERYATEESAIIQRLMDHKRRDHKPGVVYEGQLALVD